jgi:hypothetical protein
MLVFNFVSLSKSDPCTYLAGYLGPAFLCKLLIFGRLSYDADYLQLDLMQGDRIGRISAHWNLVYYGKFFENYTSRQNFRTNFFRGENYALIALVAVWHSGHRVRLLQNRRSRVRIPPGCKVFRNLYIALQCCCHNLICIVIVST